MPEIAFACHACQGMLKVAAELAGKKVRCPKCMGVNVAPVGAAAPPVAVMAKTPAIVQTSPARQETRAAGAPVVARPATAARLQRSATSTQASGTGRPFLRVPATKRVRKRLAGLACAVVLLVLAAVSWTVLGGKDKGEQTVADSGRKSASAKEPVASSKQPKALAEPESEPLPKKAQPVSTGQMTAAEAKARLQSIKNLSALAMAMRDYNDVYRRLPPASGIADPKLPKLAGMSWRAYLLPYLGEKDAQEQLLKDVTPVAEGQPWNRSDLLKLDLVPFKCPLPEKSKPGYTHYRVFVGNGAAFEPKEQTRIPFSFRDGTTYTIFIVEAAEPVPWTKPEELVYDPQKPLPKLGGLFADGFHIAFGDGTVRFFPNNVGEKLMRALITRAGGEDIDAKLPPALDREAIADLKRIAGIPTKEDAAFLDMPAKEARARLQSIEKLSPEEAKARLQSVNNLFQMALAMHAYHEQNKHFPLAGGELDPASPKLEGMSWRTRLLSFLEKQDVYDKLIAGHYPLAQGARPNDRWNRPDLLKLIFPPFSPPVHGRIGADGHTIYRVFVGKGAAFEPGRPLSLRHFNDGSTSTILIVEAGESVPWTKPDELLYDPEKPLPKLGGLSPDGFYAAFADGFVRFIPRDTDEKVIRAMITRSDGMNIENMLPPRVDVEALKRAANRGTSDTPKRVENKGPTEDGKITAQELAEAYAKDRDGFLEKYSQPKYVRVRGKLNIIGSDAYFVPGRKLPNGQPVKILLVIGGLDALGNIADGSTVIAAGYPDVQDAGLTIQKCRVVAADEAKEKKGALQDRPVDTPKLPSTDLIAATGFNDAAGINSDPTPNSPYPLDAKNKQGGAGEPGWADPWTPASLNARFQKAVVFEGDGALFLIRTGLTRSLARPQTGVFWVEQHVQVPAGGGVQSYVRDGEGPQGDGPVWKVAGGRFSVLSITGRFADTGFNVEPGKWHEVTLKIDVSAREWEFHVDGRKFTPPQPLRFRHNVERLGTVRYQCENEAGIYVDALVVQRKAPSAIPREIAPKVDKPRDEPVTKPPTQTTFLNKSAQDWIKDLESPDPDARYLACYALARIYPPAKDAVPALIKVAKEKDDQMREVAAEALGHIGPAAKDSAPLLMTFYYPFRLSQRAQKAIASMGPDVVPELVKALASPVRGYSDAAAATLGAMGPTAKAAVPALIKRCDEYPDSAAISALGEIRTEEAVPLLAGRLHDLRAAQSLGRIGPAGITSLKKALRSDDPEIRGHAVQGLACCEPLRQSAFQLLLGALKDKDSAVRFAVLEAFLRMKEIPEPAMEPVFQMLTDKSGGVSGDAAVILGRFGKRALPKLLPLLHETGSVPLDVFEALLQMGPDATGAVPKLIPLLKKGNLMTKGMAARVLGTIGPDAKDAVPALKEMLKATDGRVRLIAAYGLVQIEPTDEAMKQLVAGFSERDAGYDIARVLIKLGPAAKPALAGLVERVLKEPDARAASYIRWTISEMDKEASAAAPRLLQALSEKEPTRSRALETLVWIRALPKDAVAPLLALTDDSDPVVRRRACAALARVGRDGLEATEKLLKRLKDEDPGVRKGAIDAIAGIRCEAGTVLPALLECFRDADAQVRSAAAESLAAFGPAASNHLARLKRALQDPKMEVRLSAAWAIWNVNQTLELPTFIKALRTDGQNLEGPQDVERTQATYLLGKLGPPARVLVPELLALAEDRPPPSLRAVLGLKQAFYQDSEI